MLKSLEDVQRLGQQNFELAGKSLSAMSEGLRALAADTADYTKKSFEMSAVNLEKLASVRSLDKAVEVQVDFARATYQDFVSHSARLGEFLTDVTKESMKPFEGLLSRASGR
jgi:hypothetical protein